MEWSASYFNTYTEGDVTISFDPNVRAYNYDMFAGVEYNIDISRPAGERIVNLTFNGNPIEDDQILKLAVNNYRFGGLQNMGLISREEYFKSDPVSLRSLIRDYIKEQGTIDPVVDNNWSIIGADLDHPLREEIIQLVRDGKIEIPVSEDGRTPNVASLNVYRLAEQGLITLDGVESSDSTKEETVEVPVITEPTAALSTNYEVYTVVPGDVLWRIANRHNTDWRTIANFNSLANPNLIFPNQNLKIPVQ
jgi:LysM repeat protein